MTSPKNSTSFRGGSVNSFIDKPVRISTGDMAILINVRTNLDDETLVRAFFGSLLTKLMRREYIGIEINKAFRINEKGAYLELYPRDGELYELIGKKQ